MDTPSPFKWRHVEGDVIRLCVPWYLRYALSYRDVEELALERELAREMSSPRTGLSTSYADSQQREGSPSLELHAVFATQPRRVPPVGPVCSHDQGHSRFKILYIPLPQPRSAPGPCQA